jgi:hypothetical protein
MAKGLVEYSWSDGKKAKWMRQPDGSVTYICDNQEVFILTKVWWDKLVKTMDVSPLRTPRPRADDIPIIGEITGWRCWRVFDYDLWSLYQRHMWLPGEVHEGHLGSDEGGIYAFKTRSRALSEANDRKWVIPIIVGRVALWGDAIEAENGWRAEYAKIISLDDYYISPIAQVRSNPQVTSVITELRLKLWHIIRPKIDGDALLTTLRTKYL